MFVPPPAVIGPDLTVPLSPAGLVSAASGGPDDLRAFERSVAGYIAFVNDAADEVADTLGSYRTAVSLHLPVDLPGLIDGLRPALDACNWGAVEEVRSGGGQTDRHPRRHRDHSP
jgi:hypothetical protein